MVCKTIVSKLGGALMVCKTIVSKLGGALMVRSTGLALQKHKEDYHEIQNVPRKLQRTKFTEIH
jgi:hypothetical protein